MELDAELGGAVCPPDTVAVGLARVGAEDEKIVVGTLEELCDVEFGGPLHCLILMGRRVDEVEVEFLKGFVLPGREGVFDGWVR